MSFQMASMALQRAYGSRTCGSAPQQQPAHRQQARRGNAAACSASSGQASTSNSVERVPVYFKTADVLVTATPGQNIAEVADSAGVDIVLGCASGSCGVCEVEVSKLKPGEESDPSPVVVRACVAGIPPGFARIEIDEVTDALWGSDTV